MMMMMKAAVNSIVLFTDNSTRRCTDMDLLIFWYVVINLCWKVLPKLNAKTNCPWCTSPISTFAVAWIRWRLMWSSETVRMQVISLVCIAVWAINIGHFNDPAHGGSWLKVCSFLLLSDHRRLLRLHHELRTSSETAAVCPSILLSDPLPVCVSAPCHYSSKTVCFRAMFTVVH